AVVVVGDDDLAGAADHHLVAFGVGQVAHGGREAHRAGRLRFDVALHGGTRRRAADVEGPHRELRARLADRLGGNDADRFADVHGRAATEVTAVALRAHAPTRVARQGRTHLDLVDADVVDGLYALLVDQRSGREEHV